MNKKHLLKLAAVFCILLFMTGCVKEADKQPDSSASDIETAAQQSELQTTETETEEQMVMESDTEPITDSVPADQENELRDNQIRITVGDNSFTVLLEKNESVAALREFLSDGDKTISATNYGGFEKVCQLGTTLPSDDVQTTTSPGDVMLYSSNQIVIFYGSNSWAYTRLGKVDAISTDELEEILSGPEAEITLSLK